MAITYTEKGAGLHEAIVKAGFALRQENGVWISSNDVAVQLILDAYLLTDAVAYLSNQIDDFAKLLRDRFFKSFASSEMSAWKIKYDEAIKFQTTGLATDAPTLDAERAFRGVPLANLATRVVTQYNAATAREAKISGNAGKHKDAIKGLASFIAVNAYDWQSPMGLV